MDGFKPGQRIPSFQLNIQSDRFSRSRGLTHKLTLHGARQPYNVLRIIIPAKGIIIIMQLPSESVPIL